MAEITLSNSNSKIVELLAGNIGLQKRINALAVEHALNLQDVATTPTPTAAETAWSSAVLGGPGNNPNDPGVNLTALSYAVVVQANTSDAGLAEVATDAQIRANFDLVISRCITSWVTRNP